MGRRRATALFVCLFAGALTAAVLVVGSRSPELVLEVRKLPQLITPNGDRIADQAEIEFFVRTDEPSATVQIVDRDLDPVRTLDEQVALREEEVVRYLWDATTDAGEPVPAGRYRLRVILSESDRDMVFPRKLEVRRPPPRPDQEPRG